MAEQRIIVVGAGPAGVRATEALVQSGVRPVVIDEGLRDGGQIYRRQPEGFTRPYEKLYGTEAKRARALHETFEGLKPHIDYRPNTLVWHVGQSVLHTTNNIRSEEAGFDRLLICSGATDRLLPVPGWQFAGCYSLGAAQIALKAQACAIGRQVVFLGTGPLLYLVAAQYVAAGANVAAVLDTSPALARAKALRYLAARPAVLFKGISLTAALMRAGVPLLTNVTPIEIQGNGDSGVQAIRVHGAKKGSERTFACDAVGIGYHLRPESQLADLARCEFFFEPESRQWMPRIDQDGRSSVRGVYLAGDSARILGADGAELAGRLAAFAALSDGGARDMNDEIQRLRVQLAAMDRFRIGLLRAFPWPHQLARSLPDNTVLCRCESITAGELRKSVRDLGARELNRAKALCRVGMGRCQGRYCANAATEVIAAAANIPVSWVGRLRGQGPVKPLPISLQKTSQRPDDESR